MVKARIGDEARARVLESLGERDDPQGVVAKVRACQNTPTLAFAFLSSDAETSTKDREFRTKLVRHGIIDVVLQFLSYCNTKSFEQTKIDAAAAAASALVGAGRSAGDAQPIPGDLECPSSWTSLLYKFTLPDALDTDGLTNEVSLKIAHSIRPMIVSMTNLRERQFFGSRRSWYPNSLSFTGLVLNLFESKEATNVLLSLRTADNSSGTASTSAEIVSPAAPLTASDIDTRLLRYLVQMMFVNTWRQDIKSDFDRFERVAGLENALVAVQRDAAHALRYYSDSTSGCSNSVRKNNKSQSTSMDGEDDCLMADDGVGPGIGGEDISDEKKEVIMLLGDLPVVDPEYYRELIEDTSASSDIMNVDGGDGKKQSSSSSVPPTFANSVVDLLACDENVYGSTFNEVPALQSLLWCCFYQGLAMSKEEFGTDAGT